MVIVAVVLAVVWLAVSLVVAGLCWAAARGDVQAPQLRIVAQRPASAEPFAAAR